MCLPQFPDETSSPGMTLRAVRSLGGKKRSPELPKHFQYPRAEMLIDFLGYSGVVLAIRVVQVLAFYR